MTQLFQGICTALPTPFLRNRAIDFHSLEKMINRQINSGINALCILGTTGEASTLTFDEKISIIKFSLAVINSRVPILFGISGNNPTEIIKLGRAIKSISSPFCKGGDPQGSGVFLPPISSPFLKGGDPQGSGVFLPPKSPKNPPKSPQNPPKIGVLLTPPYYNKCTPAGAVRHFHACANAIKLPLVVYNIPSRTGMNLSPEIIAQIAQNPYICGVKECGGNIEQLCEIVRLCPNHAVYSGDDPQSLPAYSVGARGCISVASNIYPRETLEIFRTLDPNLFLSQLPFYRSLFQCVNPIPLKAMLAKLGLCRNILRPPLYPISIDTAP